jgi:membrane associated rhomboid family serine protease
MHARLDHILFNMLGLCVFGPLVERAWGSRAYLRFYLIAGAAGGVIYTLLVVLHVLPIGSLVGASGSILGLIAAAGLLFPNQELMLLGLVRSGSWLVIIAAIMAILGFLSGNAGGEAAAFDRIGGGFFLCLCEAWCDWLSEERSKGAWQRRAGKRSNFWVRWIRILASP